MPIWKTGHKVHVTYMHDPFTFTKMRRIQAIHLSVSTCIRPCYKCTGCEHCEANLWHHPGRQVAVGDARGAESSNIELPNSWLSCGGSPITAWALKWDLVTRRLAIRHGPPHEICRHLSSYCIYKKFRKCRKTRVDVPTCVQNRFQTCWKSQTALRTCAVLHCLASIAQDKLHNSIEFGATKIIFINLK